MNGRDLVRSMGRGDAERGLRGRLRWGRAGASDGSGRGAERARTPGPLVGVEPGPGGGVLRFARAGLEVRVREGGVVSLGWDGAGPLPSSALAGPPPEPDPRVLLEPDRDGGRRLVSERMTVTVSRLGAVEVRTPGGELLRRELPPRWWDAADDGVPPRWTQRAELPPDARFLGLGAPGPRLRDGTYGLRNAPAGSAPDAGEGSAVPAAPVQWVVADAGTHLSFHDCASDGRVTLREGEEGAGSGHDRPAVSELRMDGGPLRCWVIVGAPARIAQTWATLTGGTGSRHSGGAVVDPPAYGWGALREAAADAVRTRLHPYVAALSDRGRHTGAPLLRPLWWDAPEDRALRDCEDAFLLGDALLVAPLPTPDADRRTVRLPPGRWYDTATEEVFDGPGPVTVDAPLSRTPVLARAGSAIPVLGAGGEPEVEVWLPTPGQVARASQPGFFAYELTVDGTVRVLDGDGGPTTLPVHVRGRGESPTGRCTT
ncbi:hypothetical protein [Streptomyces sp. NPDC060194]|uniref:hypothetical protein n=1 Tax=Streptomyces sp. NPDC060194 TaxID=3347069 RepID=UPI003645FF87